MKTIELMLGLPALSMFDLVATDMQASFRDAGAPPDSRRFRRAVDLGDDEREEREERAARKRPPR